MKIKGEFSLVIGRGHPREQPKDTSEGVLWPSVTTDVAQLPVAHVHTHGNPEGVKRPSVTSGSHVTTVLLQRKKRGKKRGMRRAYFRTGPIPVTWLPVTWLTSFPVTWLTSLPVTWLPVAPPQILTELYLYTAPSPIQPTWK
jgi:hypothetical protein